MELDELGVWTQSPRRPTATPMAQAARRTQADEAPTTEPHLGAELALIRRGQGLTQIALAAAAGVAESSIQRLEGLGEARVDTFEAVCRVLRTRIDGMPSPDLPIRLRLRAARGERKVREVAAAAEIDPRTLQALERGRGSLRSLHAALVVLGRGLVLSPAKSLRVSRPVYGRDERFTPLNFTLRLVPILGSFALDPCGHPESPTSQLAAQMITKAEDGLTQEWHAPNGSFVFVNPPFSRTRPFGLKALEEVSAGRARTVVLLIRAAWDTLLFQEGLVHEADN